MDNKRRRYRGGVMEDGKQRTAGVGRGDLKVSRSRVQEAMASRGYAQARVFLQSYRAV